MSRILAASALALSLATFGSTAQAQSYTAPAGIPASTAPGGERVLGPERSSVAPAFTAYDSLPHSSLSRPGKRSATVRR